MGKGTREGRGDKARSRVRTTRALLVIGAPLLAARIPIFAHIRSLHMMIDPGNGMKSSAEAGQMLHNACKKKP